jgi:enediyne biosynthesis protein E4
MAAGLADMPPKSRRGAAFGDIANNGNVDIVVLNVGEPPSLQLNSNKIPNHRVLFRLEGTKSTVLDRRARHHSCRRNDAVR